jgi:DNA (cytosine-5)-methyltransferase 1
MAYYHLKDNNQENIYLEYLKQNIDQKQFWVSVPNEVLNTVINTEISDNTIEEIFNKIDTHKDSENVDLIIGGPPCQAYSIVGRARDPKGMADDPRNHLYLHYVKFLKKYNPKMFVFENVPGILSAKNGEFLEKIKEAIDEAGYIVEHKTLTSKDFGVLQNRRRVILIGWKKNKNLKYPTFENFPMQGEIMKDLFYDLPKLKPGEEKVPASYTKPINEYLRLSKIRNGIDFTTQHVARNHNERDLEIYRTAIDLWVNNGKRLSYADLPSELKTHKNETAFLNRFQVVDPTGVSHTVVAHICADGHYYIYPDLEQVRSISVREAARIQSFPDDFFFEGGRTAAFKQIGNAVPPLMAEGIANKIKEMICL